MSVIDRLRYDGKRALVVGGATGMGAAAAKSAAELGAEVIVLDYAPVNYDVAQAIQTDLRDPASIDAALHQLGGPVQVPWLDYPVIPGTWVAALIALSADAEPPAHFRVSLGHHDHGWEVVATWPDGVRTRTSLTKEKG